MIQILISKITNDTQLIHITMTMALRSIYNALLESNLQVEQNIVKMNKIHEKYNDFINKIVILLISNINIYSIKQYLKYTKIILINTESVYSMSYEWDKILQDDDIIKNKNLLMIWDYEMQNINYIKKYYDKCFYVPPAYSEIYKQYFNTFSHPNQNNNKTIDVLIYGSKNARRLNIINELKQKNVNVLFKFFKHFDQQNEMILRSRIILIVHFYDFDKPIDFYRISSLLTNKIFIIHENVQIEDDNEEFKKNVVFSDYDKLVDTCIEYLKKPQEELDQLAEKSYNFFKEKYDTKKFITDEIKNIILEN